MSTETKKSHFNTVALKEFLSVDDPFFRTHDNGSRPFKITLKKNHLLIGVRRIIDPKNPNSGAKSIPFMDLKKKCNGITFIKRVILGFGHSDWGSGLLTKTPYNSLNEIRNVLGNSIIAECVGNKILYIGTTIFFFELANGDRLEEYHSPILNNDVPYPVIVCTNNVYFPEEKTYVSKDYFPDSEILNEELFQLYFPDGKIPNHVSKWVDPMLYYYSYVEKKAKKDNKLHKFKHVNMLHARNDAYK